MRTTGRNPRRRAPAVLIGIAAVLLCSSPLPAAAQKDYAYLFLQGKISDRLEKTPLAEARIRLSGPAGVFETETDRKGVFEFERLPVADFDLEISTRDGRVLRGVQRTDPDDPDRIRLEIHLARGDAQRIGVRVGTERVSVEVPRPRTRWKKLWLEIGIFIVAAGGLIAL